MLLISPTEKNMFGRSKLCATTTGSTRCRQEAISSWISLLADAVSAMIALVNALRPPLFSNVGRNLRPLYQIQAVMQKFTMLVSQTNLKRSVLHPQQLTDAS